MGMFAAQGQKKRKSAATSSHLLLVLFSVIVVDANGNGCCCGFCVGLFVTGVSLLDVIVELCTQVHHYVFSFCYWLVPIVGSGRYMWCFRRVRMERGLGFHIRIQLRTRGFFSGFLMKLLNLWGMMRVRWVEAIVVVLIGNLS